MSHSSAERILVTAALPYTNGPVHIGQVAGAYLPPDLYCRYQRLRGRDIVFICGSDEHGVPIMLQARREGVAPQELVDHYHERIKEAFAAFGMSFDYYGRTSAPIHHETSRGFFRRLFGKKAFIQKKESQLYDPEANVFLADRFVRGTCPSCGNEDAYGDQCEGCGKTLSPRDLLQPRSAITNAEPVLRETTHWYLPLGDMQPKLEEWIKTHPEWKPNVRGQVRSWLKEGLADRAMTRDIPWGVHVPEDVADAAGVDASGKVLYVWFDAPIGYISATRQWAEAQGDADLWQKYWQDPGTRLVQFLGKDNIVFHCLIFPAILMAHGDYILPDNVPANEFLNVQGQKLSTSRNRAVWLHEYLEDFEADLLRYTLATIIPETRDSDFSWFDFQSKVNSELADTLGNFVNRTLTFAERYFDRRVPELCNPSPEDSEALRQLSGFPGRIGEFYESFRLRDAVAESMALARLGNKYFNDAKPWKTRKSDRVQCGNTIHVCLQFCASLSVLMEPIVPASAARIRRMLALEGVRSSMPGGRETGDVGWLEAGHPLLAADHVLGKPEILFHKVEDDIIEGLVERLESTAAAESSRGFRAESAESEPAPAYSPVKGQIGFDEFQKLDLRLGMVTGVDRVPKADKLLRLEVDLGFESRQVLAGIAESIAPGDLVGKRVVVVANLEPRRMRGLESQGMILMAEDRNGRLKPVFADLEPGSVVR